MRDIIALTLLLAVCRVAEPGASSDPPILEEGCGVAGLVIGRSTRADVERTLGAPEQVLRVGEGRENLVFRAHGLRVHVTGDLVETITAEGTFAGRSSRGVSLRSSLAELERAYGSPVTFAPDGARSAHVWNWPTQGITAWLDRPSRVRFWATPRIEKLVVYAPFDYPRELATPGRVGRCKERR